MGDYARWPRIQAIAEALSHLDDIDDGRAELRDDDRLVRELLQLFYSAPGGEGVAALDLLLSYSPELSAKFDRRMREEFGSDLRGLVSDAIATALRPDLTAEERAIADATLEHVLRAWQAHANA